jgi:hypothetical protein
MTEWTAKEKRMARLGWVYHKYQKRNGTRAFVSNLAGHDRADLIFDHTGYNNWENQED